MIIRTNFKRRKKFFQIIILVIVSGIIITSKFEKKDLPKKIKLRNNPITLDFQPDAAKIFKLNDLYRPLKYIKRNSYIENKDNTVSDPITGLMWQKDCSNKGLNFKNARNYVNSLNSTNNKGYNNWRLPTIDELMSLLEEEKQTNQLFINPAFDFRYTKYWSSDTLAAKTPFGERINSAWGVDFTFGYVFWAYLKTENYVRAVRSIQ